MFYVASDDGPKQPLQSGAYKDALDEFKTIAANENAALAMLDERNTVLAMSNGYQSMPYGEITVLVEPDNFCPEGEFEGGRHYVTDGSCNNCGAKNFN